MIRLPHIDGVPDAQVHDWNRWLAEFAEDWRAEVPLRLHENRGGGLGYAPPFTAAFNAYIGHLYCGLPDCEECRKARNRERWAKSPESRQRVSKAFRRLHRVAPKEFDALYSVARLGFSLSQTADRLNAANLDAGRPERYSLSAVVLLVASGIDKCAEYYSL